MATFSGKISVTVSDLENNLDIDIKEDEYGEIFLEQNGNAVGIVKKDLWALADALKDICEKLP